MQALCVFTKIYTYTLYSVLKKEAERSTAPFLTFMASKDISQMLKLIGIKQQ